MIKKLIIFIFIFFIFTNKVRAYEPTVIIINQIRGDEQCCQKGDIKLLTEVTKSQDLKDLPMGWALRFDTLQNQEIISFIPKSAELGLLLEITPKLAIESGVAYKGKENGSDWYFAKNAFLVGYSQEERKKLIDTVFETFKKKFGYFPTFTVSWMIDAWSLNYINSKYGVILHELTKEQFETDSYTLYGGVFNAPYYPSKNHPLIPGYENKLDLVIVRQTISDPVYNYGSSKSYFTSQPNDYLENPQKKTAYFEQLLNNSMNQNFHKFSVIGFENSYSWKEYGKEYINQLNIIRTKQKQGQLIVKKPGDFVQDFKKENKDNQSFSTTSQFFSGSNFGALWYFAKTYRARIIIKNQTVILDDLRIYSEVPDPYIDKESTSDYSYWIIPYIIDGSQQYILNEEGEKNLKKDNLLYGSTIPDYYSHPFGIILGEGDFSFQDFGRSAEIKFTGSKKGSIKLEPEFIKIDKILSPAFSGSNSVSIESLFDGQEEKRFKFRKHFDFLIKPENESLNLGWFSQNSFIPVIKIDKQENNFRLLALNFTKDFDKLNSLFQPDRSTLPVDKEQSIYYWNNTKAVAARNPIRLFVLPLNTIGRPTNVSEVKIKVKDAQAVKIDYPDDYSYRVTPWFIDLFSENPITTSVSLSVDGVNVLSDQQIEFIPNCKKEIVKCLTNGKSVIKYIFTILTEKKNQLLTQLHSYYERY